MASKFDFDIAFQTKILAVMVKEKSVLPVFSSLLKPTYFEESRQGTLLNLIKDFYQKYNQPPSKASLSILLEDFCRNIQYPDLIRRETLELVEAVFSVDTDDWEYVRDEVLNFCTLQSISVAVLNMGELIGKSKREREDPKSLLEKLRQVWKEAETVGLSFNEPIILQDALKDISKLFGGGEFLNTKKIYPTGFTSLDRTLRYGGMKPGDFTMLLGHSGEGKSTLAMNLGKLAAMGANTVDHITLELDADDVAQMYTASLLNVPINDLAINPDKYKSRIEDEMGYLEGTVRIQSFSTNSVTPSDIRAYLKKVSQDTGISPGVVIIDYIALLKPPDYGRGMNEKRHRVLGEMTRELIRMCKDDFGAILISPAQGTRDTYSKDTYGQEAVSESWEMAQLASLVLCLQKRSQDDKTKNIGRLIADKVRRGKKGLEITLNVVMENCLIEEYVKQTNDFSPLKSKYSANEPYLI